MNKLIYQLPFGLKNGQMVEVSEVDRGLACDCVCPICLSPLQANQGFKRQYFSHDPKARSALCENALETAIHKMAKQILLEQNRMVVPQLVITESLVWNAHTYQEYETVETKRLVHFETISEEVTFHGFRPDLLAYSNHIPFIIEIAVTHFTDRQKVENIRKLGIPAIEIDLSNEKRLITKDELSKIIIKTTENKKWLSNPTAKGMKSALIKQLKIIAFQAEKSAKKLNKPSRTPHKKERNTDLRWIRCEACHHIFEVSFIETPIGRETVECPACEYKASTALSSSGPFFKP